MTIPSSRRLIASRACWVLLASAVFNTAAGAQQSPAQTPATVVGAAFSALASQRWSDVAALVHPEALRQFREEQLHFATEWHDARTSEPVGDTASRAAREYLARQWNEAMSSRDPETVGFARVKSLEELRALSPSEIFARWLEGHHPRPQDYPGGVAPTWIRTVVGTIAETDSMAHVVYRVQVNRGGRLAPAEMEVVTLRHSAGAWRIVLNDDLAFQGDVGSTRLADPD